MNKLHYIKLLLQTRASKCFKDERGSQTIEYIAIGLLCVTIISALVGFLGDGDTLGGTANAINDTFVEWIERLGDIADNSS